MFENQAEDLPFRLDPLIKSLRILKSRKTYIKMIWATATNVLIVVPVSVVIGLCAAMLLNSLRFGADIYKTVFFLPVMATLLAMAIAWEFTLHPTMGIVNSLLKIF